MPCPCCTCCTPQAQEVVDLLTALATCASRPPADLPATSTEQLCDFWNKLLAWLKTCR